MYELSTQSAARSDVVQTDSGKLASALLKSFDTSSLAPPKARPARRAAAEGDRRIEIRKALLEPRSSDPNGFERIIGESDLTSINFLSRGLRAAAAVCRISLPTDGGFSHGSGVLVGPRLLLTNHHVLGSPREASQAQAQFGYEHDLDGVLADPVCFNLAPEELFFTDPALDVTLVAVAPLSEAAVPIERFGRIPLLPITGKALDREYVSIIQHPGGQPKQIAIRASQIVKLKPAEAPGVNFDHFIHYTTDTEPGSSGAPVFNDQWQIVALHHKAVPAQGTGDREEPVWIANEGVRVSAIFALLERRRFEDVDAARALDRLDAALGLPPLNAGVTGEKSAFEADSPPFQAARWHGGGLGYDADFLPGLSLPLAPIYADALNAGTVAPLKGNAGHELHYLHFSAVMHKQRKFALLTAVNIAGAALRHPGQRKRWRRDSRIADEFQPDGQFYETAIAEEKVFFSRGHLVRRFDPCWGASDGAARAGDEDSFHYTNAAPQFQRYNDMDWGNLEDYLLDNAQTTERRMTVFAGPIYREDDPPYGRNRQGGPWQIPLSFWKIAVLQKSEHEVSAAAFIVGQTHYVEALLEARVFTGLKPYTLDEIRSRRSRPRSRRSKPRPGSISRLCATSTSSTAWRRRGGRGGSTASRT